MTKIKKADQCEKLSLPEKLKKPNLVAEIVKNLADDFGESIDLILKLMMSDFDVERFLDDKVYKEKVLTEFYVDKNPYLSDLEFEGCELIGANLRYYRESELPNLPTCLQSLHLDACWGLKNLSGIEACENLESLKILTCSGLTSLSRIKKLKNLQSLDLYRCYSLRSLSGIEELKNLQSLELYRCDSLKSLSGIEECENLEVLIIEDCPALTSLSGVEKLKNLRELKIDSCSLENLDSESKEILKGLEENPAVEVVYT